MYKYSVYNIIAYISANSEYQGFCKKQKTI